MSDKIPNYSNLDGEQNKIMAHRFSNRFTTLKKGEEAFAQNKIPEGVSYYQAYLEIITSFFNLQLDQLTPSSLVGKLQLQTKNSVKSAQSEIFLISQIFWKLALSYDRNPQSALKVKKNLNLFVSFSLGQKHQNICSENLRKTIKNKSVRNKDLFQDAFNRLKKDSKSCYIASFIFGHKHQTTDRIRLLKPYLQLFPLGRQMINYYYLQSPDLIYMSHKKVWLGKCLKFILFVPLYFLGLLTSFAHQALSAMNVKVLNKKIINKEKV